MVLRLQQDPKPLTAVISGVLFRHASASSACGSEAAEQQAGSSHRPAKRARRSASDKSPAGIGPLPAGRTKEQDVSSRQTDTKNRDLLRQQAHSQKASGAAMNVLTSVGQGFAGRADENDDLDHGMEAEPSSTQGLLSAVTFTPGDVTPQHSTPAAGLSPDKWTSNIAINKGEPAAPPEQDMSLASLLVSYTAT